MAQIKLTKDISFLYEFLPITDKHNKQRQRLLGLERKWETRDCLFRLLTAPVRFISVDAHVWYRHDKTNSGHKDHARRNRSTGNKFMRCLM